jgi:endonuclease/exonuclease/phosphatase family metal-dependent hydrolase
MTYNIRNGRGSDGRVDLARVAAVIAAFDPDVVGLQEVDLSHARSGHVDQASELASRLSMTAHYAPYIEDRGDRHGIATLTRLPVASTHYLALPGRSRRWFTEPRCALVTRVAYPTRTGSLDIVNTHLSVVPADRHSQVAVLADVLDRDELIALGDFNCTARSTPYRMLSRNLRRAIGTSRSWPARLPMFQLDHILVRGSLTVIRAGAWTEGLARHASDHLPVFAELAGSAATVP